METENKTLHLQNLTSASKRYHDNHQCFSILQSAKLTFFQHQISLHEVSLIHYEFMFNLATEIFNKTKQTLHIDHNVV